MCVKAAFLCQIGLVLFPSLCFFRLFLNRDLEVLWNKYGLLKVASYLFSNLPSGEYTELAYATLTFPKMDWKYF